MLRYLIYLLVMTGILLVVSCNMDTAEPSYVEDQARQQFITNRATSAPYQDGEARLLLTFEITLQVRAPRCPTSPEINNEPGADNVLQLLTEGCVGPFDINAKGHGYNELLGPVTTDFEFSFTPVEASNTGTLMVFIESDESFLLFEVIGKGAMAEGYLKDKEYVVPLELIETTSKIFNGNFSGVMHIRNADELFTPIDKTINTAAVIYGTFINPG